MFDTHCHLFENEFTDITKIIWQARDAGVKYFLLPGLNIKTSKNAVEIASDFENVYAAVGIHPTEKLDMLDFSSIKLRLSELINQNEKIKAVGETGLDYYKYESSPNLQKELFKMHINLSLTFDLPIIIHNRMASNDIIEILENFWSASFEKSVILHSCPSEEMLLDFAIKRKVFISVAGDITYDKQKQNFIKRVPLELLIVETDSPLQVPEPLRSQKVKPNYPENLNLIVNKIAEIKNVDKEKIITSTTSNAKFILDIDENN